MGADGPLLDTIINIFDAMPRKEYSLVNWNCCHWAHTFIRRVKSVALGSGQATGF
jgi:hypothetical protein